MPTTVLVTAVIFIILTITIVMTMFSVIADGFSIKDNYEKTLDLVCKPV